MTNRDNEIDKNSQDNKKEIDTSNNKDNNETETSIINNSENNEIEDDNLYISTENFDVERKKKNRTFSLFEVIILIIICMSVSMSLGMFLVGNKSKVKNEETKDEYLETFIKNYHYIVDNYYETVDREKLINDAIAGMMNTLDDPYSVYIESEDSKYFNINLEGSYKGFGISFSKDTDTNYIIIYSVFSGSPADKAGLKAGDLIKSIDGESTEGIESTEFSNNILNSDKNDYKLTIIRNDEEFDINLSKENVVIDSVSSEIIEKNGQKIGYIYISIFANNTSEQFKTKLEELEKENISALIIDVRSNTGGHLTAVENILKLLLTKKQITYKISDNDEITEYYGTLKENKKYEIVLLGDSYSASASEVLISSLKDNLNSKLIGLKTYGKGTVQELITLSNGMQYKITTKKWLSPNGNWVNDTEGIEPDIEVSMDKKYYQTYDKNDDNQLQEAINYIINK